MTTQETRRALARAIPTWPKPAQVFGWNLIEQLKNVESGRCDMERMPALMAWQIAQIEERMG